MSTLDSLKERGKQLAADAEDRRRRSIEEQRAEQLRRLAALAQKADKAVRRLLGDDVAEALCEWRGDNPVMAAIGQPQAGADSSYLPGDAPGQDGDLNYYDNSGEIWYRPRFTDASARIRDRDHFAQMLAAHSIYAGSGGSGGEAR